MASDSAYPTFQHYGTNAQRLAFTPSPAAGTQPLYTWYETDTGQEYQYTTSWIPRGAGGGAVPIDVTTSQTLQTNTGWVVPESLVIDAGVILEIAGGARLEITGPVNVSAMVKLAQVVTVGSITAVDFASIPATYSALKVLWFAQDTTTGTGNSVLRLRINGDTTSANYTSSIRDGASGGSAVTSTLAASANGVEAGVLCNAGNTSIPSQGETTLVGYANTTFFKNMYATYIQAGATAQIFDLAAVWKSASAITNLTFITDGTAFVDGSTFTLYGVL
jgi:hypothetical protein